MSVTRLLYLYDSYIQEFDAKIVDIVENQIILDQTAFYAEGGGQPGDTGILELNGKSVYVTNVIKDHNNVYHLIQDNNLVFTHRTSVHGKIDWSRRYMHMKYHTAIHIISGILFKEHNAHITGSQITEKKARLDVNYAGLTRALLPEIEAKANEIVDQALPVSIKFISRENADLDKLVRVKKQLLPHNIDKIRVIDIEGFDAQADGGTHVKNTSEIGSIKITKYENKGKANKRIYIELS